MMQRYSQICEVSIEDSEVSGVQELDPKENFQFFYLVRGVKECVNEILGS